jgi:predicted MFS family arabinose efflux permease
VKWFSGYELALAMGLQVAIARIGTGIAYLTANPLAEYFQNVPNLVMFGAVLLIIGMLAFLIYNITLDKKLDKELGTAETTSPEDEFKLSDVKVVFGNYGFWLLTLLCVLFYSCVFPFLKYAPDLMTNKFGIEEKWSGVIPSVLPLGTVLLTPLFGSIYDKKGKGATIMIIGAVMLVVIHALFSVPGINNWIYALCLTVLLGISFSLVPSAMWPAVTKIIPEKQLGTAYALTFWVQNIGLMIVPLFIGFVLDKYCIIETKIQMIEGVVTKINKYDYTLPMRIFTGIAVLSVAVAFLLKREDAKKGYGLEKPNIEGN